MESSITVYDPGIEFRKFRCCQRRSKNAKDKLEAMFGYDESRDSVDANDDPVNDETAIK